MTYDVIVIDSGYSPSNNELIVEGINLSGNGCRTNIEDNIGHGTEIVNIIAKNSNKKDLKVFMIKTCDSYDGFNFDVFLDALTYIINNNMKCKVINISLGIVTSNDYNYMLSLFDILKARNIVVISAFDNSGAISYPAALPNVIGVDCLTDTSGEGQVIFVENSIVNVICTSTYYRTVDHNKNDILVKGASFAAAYISSIVINYLMLTDYSDNNKQIIDFLKSISKKILHFENKLINYSIKEEYLSFLKGVRKAIAFPFNKEIMSIAKFENMLPFEIVDYFDFDLSFNKNFRISDLYPHIKNNKILHGYSDINWMSDFDLVICGHCKEYANIINADILGEIIRKCKCFGKKIYAFDDISDYFNEDCRRNAFYPYSIDVRNNANYFGKMRVAFTPVLGIFGTSSRQGKFTLQLGIKSLMEQKGYQIGGISTEPSGYLFGYDYVHAMGYGGLIKTKTNDSVRLLNEILWIAEKNNYDLIMVGSQAGTVPYDIINMNNLLFNQYDFLVATHPDAVILCVNLFDTKDYIVRTINFIESIGYSKVIAIVVFPVVDKSVFSQVLDFSFSYEAESFMKMLSTDLGMPVFINNYENYRKVTSIVEEYFDNA